MPEYMQGLPSTQFAKAVTGNTNPDHADLAALAERLDDLTAYFDNWSDTTHSADLRLAARCVKDKAEELWRKENPKMLTCPTCKRKGFNRTAIWYPFSTESKCKCSKCGAWATAPEWSAATALAAVEEARP